MKDYKIIFRLEYRYRTISGKVINVRKTKGIEHAKAMFYNYAKKKYKNAVGIRIVEISEIYKDETLETLKNMFGMN